MHSILSIAKVIFAQRYTDTIITIQKFNILISIDIFIKILQFVCRPRSNFDTIWPLNSLLNQRIVPFSCKLQDLTNSAIPFIPGNFCYCSLLQRIKNWIVIIVSCVTLGENYFSLLPTARWLALKTKTLWFFLYGWFCLIKRWILIVLLVFMTKAIQTFSPFFLILTVVIKFYPLPIIWYCT